MGGTFDPVHYGHLVTAEEALVQFNLDKVVFMPTGQPVSKGRDDVSPAEQRYLMTVLATASNPDFEVSRMEIDRQGPTYTVDTLAGYRAMIGDEADLFFITGADAVWEILQWKDPERVVEMCRLIAATRPGYDLGPFMSSKVGRAFADRIDFMEVPALAISSTDIRERVRQSRPIRYLLPESVATFISKAGLYREGAR
ncbi:MAG: nicotinate-nucleotide adenylyltransferase [Coriobacteriia bacterium]